MSLNEKTVGDIKPEPVLDLAAAEAVILEKDAVIAELEARVDALTPLSIIDELGLERVEQDGQTLAWNPKLCTPEYKDGKIVGMVSHG